MFKQRWMLGRPVYGKYVTLCMTHRTSSQGVQSEPELMRTSLVVGQLYFKCRILVNYQRKKYAGLEAGVLQSEGVT
jgi:hypothetical protein